MKRLGLLMSAGFICSMGVTHAQTSPLYLDSNVPVDERVNDLLSRMSLEEKVAQMCQYVGLQHIRQSEKNLSVEEMKKSDAQGFYPGLHSSEVAAMVTRGEIGSFLHVKTAREANYLQQLAMKSRLHIPLLIGIDAIHGNALVREATVYPSPISIASTWSDSLAYEIAAQTAIEMRATGSHWTFTPNIDVLRDPRWGRTGETFGEDPCLVGRMGLAQIIGFQGEGITLGTQKVLACAKHMIGGGESLNGLNAAPTDISERTLKEIHLPPYREAIKDGKVFTIMAAHNELNGIPCHADDQMMTGLFREKWGFKGFFVSDWMDVGRIWHWHHVAENFKDAAALSVNAGLDMHMHGPGFQEAVLEAVSEGTITESRIVDACRKILWAKFSLGLFENPMVDTAKISEILFNERHRATALETAQKSIVLLENNGILPLQKMEGKRILVTGSNADNMTILGDWAEPQPEEKLITVWKGIHQLAGNFGYQASYLPIEERSKEISDLSIKKAFLKAKQSDIVILVLGENSFRHDWNNRTTGENMDRSVLQLSGKQLELAKRVKEAGKPLIVVLVNGSPIAEPWLSEHCDALIEAWEPGSLGGFAVAQILFGEVNPSGKLPLTIPRSVGQLQIVYNHKPTMYRHKYHDESNKPLYPFGYGKSFTNFQYNDISVSADAFDPDTTFWVDINVSNTGNYAGEEIIQLYLRDDISEVTRPVKELINFKRIHLDPGQTKKVRFKVELEDMAYYNKKMEYVVEKGAFTLMLGSSSADEDLKKIKFVVGSNYTINE